MTGVSRQAYLEKARATLAAREAWQSVFSPAAHSVSPDAPGDTDVPNRTPGPCDEVAAGDPQSTCDQSDQSDQSPLTSGLDEDVAWRADGMRGQVPATGTIPILLARPEARSSPPGTCISCGEQLAAARRFRCAPCVRAVEQVLNDVRERG